MSRLRRRLAAVLLTALVPVGLLPAGAAAATPDGALDPAFATDGVALVDIGPDGDYGHAIAATPDGKLVIAAEADPVSQWVSVARLTAGGQLDTTFGTGGKLYVQPTNAGGTPVPGNPIGVAVGIDGKVVIGGQTEHPGGGYDVFVMRRLPSGAPDPTFGVNGSVIVDIRTNDAPTDMVVQPDGKVVISGAFANGDAPYDLFAMRFTATGGLDASYGGGDGVASIDLGGNETADAIALDPAGRIILAGRQVSGPMVVARLTASGALDTSFDTDGVATLALGQSDEVILGADVRPDSRVVVVGRSGPVPFVAQLTAAGAPDPTFWSTTPGHHLLDGLTGLTLRDVALQRNGAIVAVGSASTIQAVRLTAFGALDPTFGDGDGLVEASPRESSGADQVIVRDNGRMSAVGYAVTSGSPYDAVVATWIGDATAPFDGRTVGVPRVSLAKTRTIVYTASDDNTGVATYTVRYRSASATSSTYGSYATLRSGTATPSASFSGSAGRTYCFGVKATDRAGNAGVYGTGRETCMAIPVNDRSLARAGSWSSVSSAGYYLGTASRSTSSGATLKLAGADYKRLSLVATRCQGCGKVKVYLGSTLLATVDLSATSTKRRQVIPIDVSAATRSGTITIKQVSGGKPVIIEGLAVALD